MALDSDPQGGAPTPAGLQMRDNILYAKEGNIIIQQGSTGPVEGDEPSIFVLSGPSKGKTYRAKHRVRIGRDGACEICLEGDIDVSRRHAEILRQGDAFILRDLNSKLGTFVNDDRIAEPTELHSNDIIRVGRTKLGFDTAGEDQITGPPAETPPPYLLLRVTLGERAGKFVAVGAGGKKEVKVGRDPKIDLFTGLKDMGISRHHCTVTQDDDGSFHLSDHSSINGTLLNGRRLGPGERPLLKAKDIIVLNGSKIVVEAPASAATSPAPTGRAPN